MSDVLSTTIAAAFGRHFRACHAHTRLLVDELNDEEFWTRPHPYGNSVGHLVLHLTGNLNYYIGARIAGTGYVRDRDREFTDTSRRPKSTVLESLDDAVRMVVKTVDVQTPDDWARAYAAAGIDEQTRFAMVLRCAEHFHHHLGQMIYLVKGHAAARRIAAT